MRILVIEDEKKTASYLRRGLTEKGFIVDVAGDGGEGLRRTSSGNYDLIVLDIMLPGRNGWSVLAELRKAGKQIPVLCLTARDAVEDRVKGLELGADDYLVKPFAFTELLARVRNILRRSPMRPPEVVSVADLELDLLRFKANRAGKPLDLTPKEFSLLSLLARRKGEVLSRSMIPDQVWVIQFERDTNAVDVHVRRLRAKVDDPFERRLIQTGPGMGYVLDEPD